MTANAFISGSLEPPLCVVSIAKRAHMHEALRTARHFGVNILADTQVEVSEHFAGKPNMGLAVEFDRLGPAPLLANACARIVAETVARHDCGDHTIFIGEIQAAGSRAGTPLLWYRRGYHGLAE